MSAVAVLLLVVGAAAAATGASAEKARSQAPPEWAFFDQCTVVHGLFVDGKLAGFGIRWTETY